MRSKVKEDRETVFGRLKRKISDFFYDLSVRISAKIHKNKVKTATTMHSRRVKQLTFYWAFIAIPVLHYIIFYICVNINSILLAFKQCYFSSETGLEYFEWYGFGQFSRFFQEFFYGTILKKMFLNSLTFYGIGLIVGIPLALFFSFYIYKKYFFSEFFRVMLFLPSMISSVVTVFMYKYFVDVGLVEILAKLGKEIAPPLSNPAMRMPATLFYNVMISFGTNILMYSSAMTRIPVSVVEYAALDGVKPFKEFTTITVPLIFDTISTFLIVGISGIFANQANLYVMYAKSATIEVQTFGYYLFILTNMGVSEVNFPYAAAMGLLFTLIILPITLLLRWLLGKINPDVQY